MRRWESRGSVQSDNGRSSSICLSGIQGSEPDCMMRLVPEHNQPHIRSPLVTAARLRRAGLRKTRTILENGVSGHGLLRFVDLDPSQSKGVLKLLQVCRLCCSLTGICYSEA